MDPAATTALRIASGAAAPLIKRLFRQDGPGAGLVAGPVRMAALVTFRGEKRTLTERDLGKLAAELVKRGEQAAGPHDPRLPPGERAALVDAVVRTLHALGDLDMDHLQAVGLGPAAFAARLRRQAGPAATRELSRDAALFHDRLVNAACLHILHFFSQRSTFTDRTLLEQSQQLAEIIRLLQTPDADEDDDADEDEDPEAAFEREYAASMVRLHDQLTIVGVDFANSPDTWSLGATYLGLGVETSRADGAPQPPVPLPLPVDQALAGAASERVLLRGIAGSGKTTLVQWLAVSTAGDRLPAALAQRLAGRVPFVLPVRRFSDDGLPAPADFLSAAHHPLAGSEPTGWAARVLNAGRGLLLIDGLDEAPAARREPLRRQLAALLRAFPDNFWLVTSRPSAVRDDWLAAQGFTELSQAPMNREQVARFIRMWHAAAAGDAGARRDATRLPEYERRLLNAVATGRELGRLATNPLMCGLICALNRDRYGILPQGRKALYTAALAMLLERRDPEREVDADGITLEREAKERLLQKLAHWMLLNDRSEVSHATAVGILGSHLPAIPSAGAQGNAEQLFDHLLHRTGLLRKPAPDTVDFVHRTFQDYLSAKEAVERHDFPFLVNNAHRPDWDEVIRMAVSLARPDESARLMTSMVSARPHLRPSERTYLKLLAASCVDFATEMKPEVREEVRRRTRYLLQRHSALGARGLAWVGPIVLDLLPDPEGLSDARALRLAETATRVGDDAAIDYLIRLRSRTSREVREELAGAWHRFDTRRYATEIIAHLDPTELYFTVTNADELAALSALGGRARVRVAEGLTPDSLLAGLPADRLTHLYLLAYDTTRDMSWLTAFPHLRVLSLAHTVGTVTGVPPAVTVERDER